MEYTNQDTTTQEPLYAEFGAPPVEPAQPEQAAPTPSSATSSTTDAFQLSFWEKIEDSLDRIPAWLDKLLHRYQCPYCFATIHRRMKEYSRKLGHRKAIKLYRCASCRTELPADFFASRSKSIAVVGGVQSGKTSYITLFCELLLHRKSLLGDLGIYGSIINSEGKEQFDTNRSILIHQQFGFEGTVRDQAPIVVRLHNRHHKKATYITLMDSPGEQFSRLDDLIQKHPNLQYAHGIVFLMNPLDIGELLRLIRQENPGTVPPNMPVNSNNFEIVETLYQMYLRTGRVKPNHKIKAHTAFCLSRADLIEEIANLYLPPDFDPDMEDVQDILAEVDTVSTDLKELLEETDKKLLNIMDKQFRNYALFPVSPLGKTPRQDNLGLRVLGGVEPKGVLLPFIWILHQTKFIVEP